MENKIIKITLIIVLVIIGSSVFAVDRYWVGNGSNTNWNSTANWSTTSGGASGASVPGSSDDVYYDGNGVGQCIINATVNIRKLSMGSGYTDTIKQNSNTITVGTSGMILSGGVFLGGSATVTDNGVFTLSGCIFTNTSSTLTIVGNYTFSSGTFTHNNGTIIFTATSTITGNTTFYNLNFSPATTSTYTIDASTTLICDNTLTTSGSASITINSGTINAKGDITISNTSTSSTGTALINICGTGAQIFTGGTINQGKLCSIKIDKSSGALTLKNAITVAGNWTYIQGTIDATTFTSTVAFSTGTRTISGSHSLNNISIDGSTTTISTNDTLTALGELLLIGSSNAVIINTGTINAKGDITITNTHNANSGTGIINICGTGNQILTGGSINQGRICSIKINKPSGTLTLKNTINVFGNWTYTQGTVDATTYNSTVVFSPGTRTVSGTHSLNNVSIDGSTNTISTNDTLTVLGELKIIGTNAAIINTGTIKSKGDITITNNHTAGGGTGLISVCGTGSQILTGTPTINHGKLCNVKIDKLSGTLTLKNIISVVGNWIYTQGTIDATTYSSTVVFAVGTRTISGTHSLYNVSIDASTNTISTNDTLTALGELKIIGTNFIVINTGTINAKGDITVTNNHGSNSGTAFINICGTGTQTLTGSGIAGLGELCNVKINKPSGTLNLSSLISVVNLDGWVYAQGTVDPGTSTVCFSGSTQNIPAFTFYSLTSGGSGTKTATGALVVNGVLTTNSLVTLDMATYALSGSITSTSGTGTLKTQNTSSTPIPVGKTWTPTVQYNSASAQTIVNGNYSSLNGTGGNRTLSSTGTVGISGTFTVGAGTYTVTGSTVDFDGASQNIPAFTFNNLTCSGSGDKTAAGALTVNGALIVSSGRILNMGTNLLSGTIASTSGTGTIRTQNTTSTPVPAGKTWTQTIKYDASGAQTIVNGNYSSLDGTGGNRTLSSTGTIGISGAFTKGSGTYTITSSTVNFNGITRQYVPAFTFNNLTVNKSSGVLELNGAVTVNTALTLTEGIIKTTSSNILHLIDNATCSAGSDLSYVHGPMKKTGNDTITFPLGDTTLTTGYHPLFITAPTSATDAFTAEYKASSPITAYGDSLQADSLEGISDCEYWILTRDAGTSTVIPTVGWNSNCTIENYEYMRLANWDGSRWNPLGGTGLTITNNTGRLTAVTAVSGGAIVLGQFKRAKGYAVLKRKLDAGYVTVKNGALQFKFDEEYVDSDSKLSFKIYNNMHSELVNSSNLPSILQLTSAYGERWYSLNILSCSISSTGNLGNGYFILEVENAKKEKRYLRFKHEVTLSPVCSGG